MNQPLARKIQRLYQLIARDTQKLQQLNRVMQQLSEALHRCNSAEINRLIECQQQLLQSIDHQGQQRDGLLQALGFSADKTGITQLLKKLPPKIANPIVRQWQAYLDEINACHQLNQNNGLLMAQQQQLINRLLSKAPHQHPNLQSPPKSSASCWESADRRVAITTKATESIA
ncbi:flagella synthesis protein FlgN [Dongshaea marina]|uniref:flagella synthesis protein FlgN n=1 Tax=Dongshaea marina TaxID=2047966 RepID=UPI000D3ECF22|nr:flagellar protein FlgN [Dongshaea marina]